MKKIAYSFIVLVIFLFGCGTKRGSISSPGTAIENKYSKMLGVNQAVLSNKKLYSFIDDWYGVKYKYGGKSKDGIDCSGFVSLLYKEVYGKELSGPVLSIRGKCKKISMDELSEGDLVFFKIESKEISHVGLYLHNNKFVHATTHNGVMISDLNEEYYKKYFVEGGRVQ
ncbi:MAG TPA: NlpC/P60 family protein [Bacteroidia bacterium]